MDILSEIYEQIIHCVPVPPEIGGIIGVKKGIVSEYFLDAGIGTGDRAIYVPNIEKLNQQILIWSEQKIIFGGIVHSHPHDQPSLSSPDISYIRTIFHALPSTIDSLFFPIVLPNIKILSFKAIRQKGDIYIYEDKIHII